MVVPGIAMREIVRGMEGSRVECVGSRRERERVAGDEDPTKTPQGEIDYAINRSQSSWSIHRFQSSLCLKGPEQCTNFVLGAWIESERMRRGTAEEREAMCREFLNGER